MANKSEATEDVLALPTLQPPFERGVVGGIWSFVGAVDVAPPADGSDVFVAPPAPPDDDAGGVCMDVEPPAPPLEEEDGGIVVCPTGGNVGIAGVVPVILRQSIDVTAAPVSIATDCPTIAA